MESENKKKRGHHNVVEKKKSLVGQNDKFCFLVRNLYTSLLHGNKTHKKILEKLKCHSFNFKRSRVN